MCYMFERQSTAITLVDWSTIDVIAMSLVPSGLQTIPVDMGMAFQKWKEM